MALFVPDSGHPFLSAVAQALSPEDLAIYADEAETLLGISAESGFSASQEDRVKGAVARQISTLVEFDPVSVLLESDSRGARSRTFKPTGLLPVNPLARATVNELLGRNDEDAGGYRTLSSFRGRTLTPERRLPDSAELR